MGLRLMGHGARMGKHGSWAAFTDTGEIGEKNKETALASQVRDVMYLWLRPLRVLPASFLLGNTG